MLIISNSVSIPLSEVEMSAVRAQGAGGQNVNKVSTAVHLRFDIKTSSLPEFYKERLFHLKDYRITKDGQIVIKAQRYRSQEKNREDALTRLKALISGVAVTPTKRKATLPSHSSREKRLESKLKRSRLKANRTKIEAD